jgi:hypothetical protein
VTVDVAVAVAGVIFVGHDHDDVCDYDHPSLLQLGGASILERRHFLPPFATSLCLPWDYGGRGERP